jgi:transcriptional regulator with XRE-family HTH domain
VREDRIPADAFRRIIEERMDMGWSQAEIAHGAKVGKKLIYMLKSGKQRFITLDNADKIVTHLLGPMSWYSDHELNAIYMALDELVEPPAEIAHGTRSTYQQHRCRCEACTEANRVYNRAYDQRVREAA